MKLNARYLFLTAFIAAAAGLLPQMSAPAFAQATAPEANRGMPHDWSHRHLIYTNPDTHDEAARKGTLAFEQWREKNKDPRFAAQVARKTRFVQPAEHSSFSPQQLQWANRHRRDPPPVTGPDIHRDWSHVLGGAAGVGKAGVFPAKFGFDVGATPSCANDFVVYTTNTTSATSPGAFATQTGTFTANPSAGQTATITHNGISLILTAASPSSTSNLGLNFEINAAYATTASNLANAIARNGGRVGVTATNPSSGVVRVTSRTSGSATGGITLGESMASFVWNGAMAGGTGTAGQPTIVAFNQLYSSCGTTPTQAVPAMFWSYNTLNNSLADTSPVLSIDGKQVAFVQRLTTNNRARLVLLKWSSTASVGNVGAPTTLTNSSQGNYRGCTAPCMRVINFNGNRNNTNSSPYYDYTNDVIYVGDDGGYLHKFTGVFNGTPTEVTAGPWPVAVSTGNKLSSPVYDSASSLVFVGSGATTSSGGRMHSVNASSGAVLPSAQLAATGSTGVLDAPIVDSTAQKVYTFVGQNANNRSAVYQLSTASLATSGSAEVGMASNTSILYAGTFDNAYWTSNQSSPTGGLYACGSDNSNGAMRPTMWKIPIAGNAMQTSIQGASVNNNQGGSCSAVTSLVNGVSEFLFASVTAGGNKTGCDAGCIYSFDLSGIVTWSQSNDSIAYLLAPGGTSGIIIDNTGAATSGYSQIYYSTLTSPGNAVQASQAALQ